MSETEIEEQIAEEMGDEHGEGDGGDTSETDAGAETPGEPEDAAPAARSQKEIEALTKKLEAEGERHAKRVAEIMGDDFALLVPSPVDWTPGFIFNVPAMHPQPEQVAELHALLGQSAPTEYKPAQDAEACEACNALGDVLTGSRKPGQETKLCVACNGSGWKTKVAPLAQVAPLPQGQPLQPGQPMSPEAYQVKDSWGRPAGHVHFGIDPVAIGA